MDRAALQAARRPEEFREERWSTLAAASQCSRLRGLVLTEANVCALAQMVI